MLWKIIDRRSRVNCSFHAVIVLVLIEMDRRLLTLPLESRTEVYKLLDNCDMVDSAGHKVRTEPEKFATNGLVHKGSSASRKIGCHRGILRRCRQCYEEASPILSATNAFLVNDRIDPATSPRTIS